MIRLGFTGTRNIAPHEERLREYIGGARMHIYFSNWGGFVTGGCRGWDAMIGEHLALRYPNKEHVVVVPANRSQVDPWWEKFDPGFITIVEMEDGTDYRDRNTEIVNLSESLFYCADYPEGHPKSTRSGTWMTVRIARNAGKMSRGITLNLGE